MKKNIQMSILSMTDSKITNTDQFQGDCNIILGTGFIAFTFSHPQNFQTFLITKVTDKTPQIMKIRFKGGGI